MPAMMAATERRPRRVACWSRADRRGRLRAPLSKGLTMRTERVLIMGAAGRDFHDFNVVYRDDPTVEVVAFTATQIPGIADRRYPAALAGERYPDGHPDPPRGRAGAADRGPGGGHGRLRLQRRLATSRSCTRPAASSPPARTSSCSASSATLLASTRPVVAVCAVRTGSGKSQTSRHVAELARGPGPQGRGRPPSDALRGPRRAALPALRDLRGPRPLRDHDRGARGVRAASRCGPPRVRGRGLRGDPAGRRGRGRRGHLGRRQQRPAVLSP